MTANQEDQPNHPRVDSIPAASQQPLLFTSRMAIVEMVSAFARRMREGA